MCTLTWSMAEERLSVFFNRDELRSRSPGWPPRADRIGGMDFLAPRDADAGGTWAAVNAAGLVLCLLNGYVDDSPPANLTLPEQPSGSRTEPAAEWTSRGQLIDLRIGDLTPAAVADAMRRADLQRYRSFLLCALHPGHRPVRIAWLHGKLTAHSMDRASMPVSSSSFDTAAVLSSRRREWDALADLDPHSADDPLRFERHRTFHRSHEPGRGAYSVCMARPDARTVSYTEVHVSREQVQMDYLSGPPCSTEAARTTLTLARCRQSQ